MPLLLQPGARLARAALLAALLVSAGCKGESPSGPDGPTDTGETPLQVTVVTFGVIVSSITAEVTGPGIGTPLLFNLALMGEYATGTIRIPPGDDRTITLRAFDETGAITHEGSATIDVRPGMNPSVAITLRARAGQVPIDGTISSLYILVQGGNGYLATGQQQQFTAQVYDAYGQPLVVPDGDIEWAVSNPAFAEVSGPGLITGIAPGTTLVVANFEGSAGVASLIVQASGTASVSGFVASPEAGALLNVGVTVSGVTAYTTANGSFSLPSVPTGPATLSLSNVPDGCLTPAPQDIVVPDGGDLYVGQLSIECTGGLPFIGAMIFSEVMADPTFLLDADGEWMELYNASGSVLSLDGWTIAAENGTSCTLGSGLPLVAPGAYVVVGASPDPDLDGVPSAYVCTGGLQIGNSGFTLTLASAGAEFIDAIALGTATPGASFNLSPFFLDGFANDDPTTWCLGSMDYGFGDLGTPGSANTQCN